MKKICVLYGGNSSEREISLKSGKFIYKSLLKNGYKSHLIDYADLTELEELKDFNLVFIALHGEEGESGVLQAKMEKAGIDTNKYKAHSTRSASSTAMKRAGMTIQAILAKANWSKKSNTFRRFYDRT